MSFGAFDVGSLLKTMGPFASYAPQPTFEAWRAWALPLLKGLKHTGVVAEREWLQGQWLERQREIEAVSNQHLIRPVDPRELEDDDDRSKRAERRARIDRAIENAPMIAMPRNSDESWFDPPPPSRPAASTPKRTTRKAA